MARSATERAEISLRGFALEATPRLPLRLVWSAENADAPVTLEPGAAPELVAFHRGYMLGMAGQAEKAIAQFRRAIKLKPDYAEAHHNLGVMLSETDRFDEAVDAFVEAVRLKPGYAGSHRDLGVMLAATDAFLPAIESFRKAIRLKPNDAQVHHDLGSAFMELADWSAAIDSFRAAIRLNDSNEARRSHTHRSLGMALRATNQLAAAIEAFDAAIRLSPGYAPPYLYLGRTLHEVGEIAAAIAVIRKAVEIRPTYAAAHFDLGMMLQESGQFPAAIDAFLAALRFGRNDEYRIDATAAISEILDEAKRATQDQPGIGIDESKSPDYTAGGLGESMGNKTAEFDAVAADALKRGLSIAELKDAIEDKLAAKGEKVPHETTTHAMDDTRLGRLQVRYEKRLQEIDLPDGGFTTPAQVRAADRLAKTFRDLQEVQSQLGLPVTEKPDRVTEAVRMASMYRLHHTKAGELIPPRPRGRPRRRVPEQADAPLR